MATDAMSEMVPVHRRPKDLEFEGGNFQSPAPKSAMKKRLKGFLNLLLNRNSTRHEETDMDFENPYATQEISAQYLDTPNPASPSRHLKKKYVNDISNISKLSKISKVDQSAFDA